MASCGNVAPNRIDRSHKLAEPDAGLSFPNPFLRFLPFGKASNVGGCSLEGSAQLRRHLFPCSGDFRLADAKCLSFKAIKFASVTSERFIAMRFHVAHDPRG